MNAPFETYRVYDPLLRLLHAWNALAIVGLIATSQVAEALEHSAGEDAAWQVHIQFGYALLGGLAARLLWGFVGPETARWSDLWHPREWAAMLRGRLSFPPRLGHDVRASLAFLALYGLLALMAATGLALAAVEFETGPLAPWLGGAEGLKHAVKEPHEAGFALVLAFIGLHMAALLYHRFVLGKPVDQAMVTGEQHLPQEKAHA